MIDTIISLKVILILILGILILDEVFLGLQTAETVNFYAGRAALVDENVYEVDEFFNENILKYFIYTKTNPFVRIRNLQTTRDEQTSELITFFKLTSNLHTHELDSFRQDGYFQESKIEVIRP
ncbi:MAG: hypothetical protein R2877_07805 [Bdellovibrionota bacterium]